MPLGLSVISVSSFTVCSVEKTCACTVYIPYSGLFSRRLYFANFAKAQPIFENKNLER